MKIQKTHRASLLALTMLFALPASLMAADGKWDRMLDALHHNKAATSQLSKQDRTVLEATILLKAHRPEQAMSILEDQLENPLIKQLKVQAAREHLVEVVRRAGGTRSEVKLPAPSEGLNKALAEVDARLQTFMHQLDKEKAKPARAARHSVRVAKKAAVSAKAVNQNIKPAAVAAQLADKPQPDAVVNEQPIAEKRASEVRSDAADTRVLVAKAIPSGVTDEAGNAAAVNAGMPVSPEVHDAALQAVEAWRVAWSNRNLDAYFSAYADDYDVTDRFASMDAWKTYKRWVIGKRSSIQVRLELIKVHHVSADHVRVEFLQHFRADDYQSDDLKALTLRRSDSGWKIVREESMNKPD